MAKKNEEVKTEELVVAAPEALAVDGVEDFGDFSDDSDKRTADELVLERLRLVQAMTKGKSESGLKDGQIYSNMTRKGYDDLLVVPVYDWREVVERTTVKTDKPKGAFIRAYGETAEGSGDFGDDRVNKAIAAVGGLKNLRKSLPDANGNVTELVLTYNCYVAILDPSNGTTVKGFGVLQADKTNIRPYLLWRQNRVDFDGATNYPTYAFRTVVDGRGTYKNPEGNVTQQYGFKPYLNDNWKESCLVPSKHKALLLALREQRKLMASGALKVADHATDEAVSEDAQEEAAF
jgi:hypothetical protein